MVSKVCWSLLLIPFIYESEGCYQEWECYQVVQVWDKKVLVPLLRLFLGQTPLSWKSGSCMKRLVFSLTFHHFSQYHTAPRNPNFSLKMKSWNEENGLMWEFHYGVAEIWPWWYWFQRAPAFQMFSPGSLSPATQEVQILCFQPPNCTCVRNEEWCMAKQRSDFIYGFLHLIDYAYEKCSAPHAPCWLQMPVWTSEAPRTLQPMP